jgi:hypothetical protein
MFQNVNMFINDTSHFSFMATLMVEVMSNYYLSRYVMDLAVKFHAFSELGTEGHNSPLHSTLPDCRMGPETF